MKLDFEPTKVQRNASGDIDMHYYEQKAHEERSCALRAIGRTLIKQFAP